MVNVTRFAFLLIFTCLQKIHRFSLALPSEIILFAELGLIVK